MCGGVVGMTNLTLVYSGAVNETDERMDGWTDGQTDGRTDKVISRLAWRD